MLCASFITFGLYSYNMTFTVSKTISHVIHVLKSSCYTIGNSVTFYCSHGSRFSAAEPGFSGSSLTLQPPKTLRIIFYFFLKLLMLHYSCNFVTNEIIMSEMRLYDADGGRLYLTQDERAAFLAAAKLLPPDKRTFAETLAYSGCRISEALELQPKSFELSENRIVLRSLKKRRNDIYRGVPVPPSYLDTINVAHNIVKKQKNKSNAAALLWPWSRMHAYRIITETMKVAGINEGKHRSPKGLRHAYGVHAVLNDVPLSTLQKWMGHADMKTTAIYVQVSGKEETQLASKMWE